MLWRLLRLRETRTNEQRIAELRRRGARIGNSCLIYSTRFSTEPYLIDIGDHVGIAGGVQFITHHGFAMIIRRKHPDAQIFGRIRVGSGTVIGIDAILLPGTEIGKDCIVGARAVVRGTIPDNSLVVGNPAKVVGRASLVRTRLEKSPHRLDVFNVSPAERRRRIEEHFHIA
jgi:acetyltransferase-like isoleucine patch superfamily enzyme